MIITVSKYDSDYVVNKLNISPKKVFFNPPCLPEIYFTYKADQIVVKKKVITYCGTWIERKGVKAIETVIPNILRKYPEYTFRIIGTGDQFEIKNHFPEDILNRIELYPLVTDKETLIDLYRDSSIFLFPSLCESFGLVVAEAMFNSCAVITGPTGFAADVIDNVEAIVLQDPNSDNIYEALEKLIQEPKFSESIAINGKKKTEELRWSNYRNKLSSIINQL